MSTVFEELSQLQAKREQAFDQIVEDIVEGRAIAADVVDQICRDAGKLPSELSSIVGKRKRIKAIEEEVARLPALLEEREQLQQKVNDANAELESAVARHQQVCRPLQHRLSDIAQEASQLEQKKNRLAAGLER